VRPRLIAAKDQANGCGDDCADVERLPPLRGAGLGAGTGVGRPCCSATQPPSYPNQDEIKFFKLCLLEQAKRGRH
jgi:hypothetical protein